MPRSKGRTGRPYRRLRAQVMALVRCVYCHLPVDTTLSGRDPQGPTLAHLQALIEGGAELDPANTDLAHLSCNVAAENRRRAAARRAQQVPAQASRIW